MSTAADNLFHIPLGGPAFPCALDVSRQGEPPAVIVQHGMGLRDYFAAKAMHALIVSDEVPTKDDGCLWFEEGARLAYLMADAMLAARQQPKT